MSSAPCAAPRWLISLRGSATSAGRDRNGHVGVRYHLPRAVRDRLLRTDSRDGTHSRATAGPEAINTSVLANRGIADELNIAEKTVPHTTQQRSRHAERARPHPTPR